jgi:aminopeptidase N
MKFTGSNVTKTIIFILLILQNQDAFSQLLDQRKVFGRKDSLRGSLRAERECFDVSYYDLEVAFDTLNSSISGRNHIHFRVVEATQTIQIDLEEKLVIDSIIWNQKVIPFKREYNAVFVQFPEKLQKASQQIITVKYHGQPVIAKRAPWDGGFVWSRDKDGNLWAGVACEGLGASSWWPCKDHLSDEPDSMKISCIVPTGLKAVCNGNLVAEQKVNDKQTAFSWKVSYPINTYNVTFNIGNYAHWSDTLKYRDGDILALDYYVMPYNLELSKKQFEQVKPMLLCYEKYLGKYPFIKDGYALVETPYLGMEHQGAIAYGNKYRTGYDGKDFSRIGLDFDYIIIHETGHEWWGNSVSCADIADMWIHESFCTYSEAIYVECMHGKAKAKEYINAKKSTVRNKAPIQGPYGVNEEGDGDMYNKGMLMLNTIRNIVGDDELWWQIIKGISDTAFKIKVTNADEIIAFFNKKSGMNLTPVFHQYLKYAKLPVMAYSIKKKGKQFKLTYVWETDVADFKMPVFIQNGKKLKRLEGSNAKSTVILEANSIDDIQIATDLMFVETKKL